MADLSTISANNPAGTETPTLGDNRIRALTDAVINSFFVEHALAGEHKVGVGPLADRPAAGHSGRFWILTEVGLSADLQYDTGSAWVTLTSLNTLVMYATLLAAHQASNPIDHVNQSITHGKIKSGDIRKKHFIAASTDTASVAALVSGSSADALHSHSQYEGELTLEDGEVTPIKLSASRAGSEGIIRGQANTERTIINVTYTRYKEIEVHWPGVYTISFTLFAGGGGVSGSTVYGQVFRNGTPDGIEHICTAEGGENPDVVTTYTEDFTFVADDVVQLYAYLVAGSIKGTVKDFRLLSQWETTINQD